MPVAGRGCRRCRSYGRGRGRVGDRVIEKKKETQDSLKDAPASFLLPPPLTCLLLHVPLLDPTHVSI